MEPALGVALLALLFVGTHVGLATRRVRDHMVGWLGEAGFMVVYSLVAALTFWALVSYYATHRLAGAPGLGLGGVPVVREALLGVIVVGVVLMGAGLGIPARLAPFVQTVRPPYGLERITRHSFFAGTALVGIAHVFLATRLAGAALMGALAALSIAGARHQDGKFLRRYGRPYADYLAVTSAIPFAAILAGRQRFVWRELSPAAVAFGIGTVVVLRLVHPSLFAGGGRWMMLVVIGGAALASLQSWLLSRRTAARPKLEEARGKLEGAWE